MPQIDPLLADHLKNLADFREAIVLTSARQTGTSSLLCDTFPHHHDVSLESPSAAMAAELDPEDFVHRHPPLVLEDEVQAAPGL